MILDIFEKVANELFFSDHIIPFYTMAIIAFWYVVFLALFDIMELLSALFEDYIKPLLKKLARHIIMQVYLRYLDLSDRVRFYQDKKVIKGGKYKEIKELEDMHEDDII